MVTQRLFGKYGEFCASHPWEVIVATLTAGVCLLSLDNSALALAASKTANLTLTNSNDTLTWKDCSKCPQNEMETLPESIYHAELNAFDTVVMTAIRCMAILFAYYQFFSLLRLKSKHVLIISAGFTIFSSIVFTSTVTNFVNNDINALKDALFFFLLLIDLSKIAKLAELATQSNNRNDIKRNISKGMAELGPKLTMDTLVEILLITIGMMSGLPRLNALCYFAVLSVIVNYLMFMTVYPACLSFILEIIPNGNDDHVAMDNNNDDGYVTQQRTNLVVQRLKLLMSFGLMLIHAQSRWLFDGEIQQATNHSTQINAVNATMKIDATMLECITRWLTVSVDHVVMAILLFTLMIKFLIVDSPRNFRVFRIYNREPESKVDFCFDGCKSRKSCVSIGTQTDAGTQTDDFKCDHGAKTIECDDGQSKNDGSGFECETVRSERSFDECLAQYKSGDVKSLTDNEIILLVKNKTIPSHKLESCVAFERGVHIRRKILSELLQSHNFNVTDTTFELPYKNYDYSQVFGTCCENVIGYIPIPVGFAGPLKLDGKIYYVPMATTEGCLVASTNRGCRALSHNGVVSEVVADGMTRAPVVRFPSLVRACKVKAWLEKADNFEMVRDSFNSTSRFAKLTRIQSYVAGRLLYLRFVAQTGDAMGMNMVSKGTESSLQFLQQQFPDLEVLSISGNGCSDKKPSAINWIEGRGKSVVCESIVPAKVVTDVLKTTVGDLVEVNQAKNLVGSAIAGSIGGFNAHAANMVTAIYLATGQDPAQNVASSNCITLMEPCGKDGNDLYISCSMPSIEIGTVGGGTGLSPQSSCLQMLGVKGANRMNAGENARQLARIVCATVLAGELSLMSALTSGHLVSSHLKFNRASTVASAHAT